MQTICPQCGTDFPEGMSNARRGDLVYCSASCKDEAEEEAAEGDEREMDTEYTDAVYERENDGDF